MYSLIADLVQRNGEASIERWSPGTWEALSLQTLWRVCRVGVHGLETPAAPTRREVRHRDGLLEATGEDSDSLVHEVLIRFCAAFADQGFAVWSLPNREQGFYRAFRALYRQPGGPPQALAANAASRTDPAARFENGAGRFNSGVAGTAGGA